MLPVSLLVPCHNAARYLPRLFESARQQTVPFAEILCYDDGSDDDTSAVARSLGAQVIGTRDCRGPSVGRNRLADAARCEWIHFHDADDLMAPTYLETALGRVDETVDVIVCDSDWVDEETRQLVIGRRYRDVDLQTEPIPNLLINPIGVISSLYRRQRFLAMGGFDETMRCWEDADVHVRLATAGARFAAIEQVLVYSLRHDRGLSRDQANCWKCRLQFLKRYAVDLDPSTHSALASEAERAAVALLDLGDRDSARTAVRLCLSLGGKPPTTENRLLKLIKPFVPAFTLLRLQRYVRGRAASRSVSISQPSAPT
jgi:glycosyltransferase involved in cell wall biosynthesis